MYVKNGISAFCRAYGGFKKKFAHLVLGELLGRGTI